MKRGRAVRHLLHACILLAGMPATGLSQKPGLDAEARFQAGLAHLRDGRTELALKEFKASAEQEPKNPYFQKGLGITYMEMKRWTDAVAAFRKALELNPYYVDVRNDLGTALVFLGRKEEAKKEFLTAFNDPTNPTPEQSAYNLGQACLTDKNYGEAESWFRTCVARNKAFPLGYLGLVDVMHATGRSTEAIPLLESGLKEIPGQPAILLTLGDAYTRAGRFTEARAKLTEAVAKDPAGPEGRRAAELLQKLPKAQ
jgi:Tfp pilus assembly protein PilF